VKRRTHRPLLLMRPRDVADNMWLVSNLGRNNLPPLLLLPRLPLRTAMSGWVSLVPYAAQGVSSKGIRHTAAAVGAKAALSDGLSETIAPPRRHLCDGRVCASHVSLLRPVLPACLFGNGKANREC